MEKSPLVGNSDSSLEGSKSATWVDRISPRMINVMLVVALIVGLVTLFEAPWLP